VRIQDARNLIPEDQIFFYTSGTFPGSVAGFSDIFRSKLLYEIGGWYVDMDVLCLKTFDMEEEYVFRNHRRCGVVGNIMKCPKGCSLSKDLYKETKLKINKDNTYWELPLKILLENIKKHNLVKFIRTDIANDDSDSQLRKLIALDEKADPQWYAVHWCNEHFKTFGVNYILGIEKKAYWEKNALDTRYRLYIKPS